LRRWLKPAAFPLLLFALNFYFVKELFWLEYSQYMGSIEAAYISISRYMIENWRDLTWFPLWYGGIPFQNTYPPLLHALVALAAGAFRISPAHAHHLVTAMFYCLGPIALYALALRLTGSRWPSFCAAWMYSILAPSFFLMPSVRYGMGGEFGLRRLQTLVPFGEGPHITSLALLPIALLSLDVALSKRRPLTYVLTAISMAAVVLSNWLGAFALAIAVFAYLLSRQATLREGRIWLTTLALGALAYLLVCPWIPPSTILDIRHNAQTVGGPFEHVYGSLPIYIGAGILAAFAAKYAMERWKVSPPLQFFALFVLFASAIPLASEWFHIVVVQQPERYHLEMDMAISLALTFAAAALIHRLAPRYRIAAVCLLVLLTLLPARLDRRYARRMIKPIDISSTIEFQVAHWFHDHVDDGRVMAPGTISYWLNAFTDTPQFGGGFDQGIVNRSHARIQYQIYSADNAGDRAADVASVWLRAYGVQAIAVGDPASREAYKPFRHPEVFAKAFPEAMRDGGDAVYWVPGRSASLAHVVDRANLVRDQPIHGLDVSGAQAFVQALNIPADFHWTSRHSAEIEANLRPDQVVAIQITYHPGWRALVNGRICRLFGDGLGQMVAEPNCNGSCQLKLIYDGGLEMRIAKMVSGASWLGCIGWILFRRGKR
jgi:hypothetical protein